MQHIVRFLKILGFACLLLLAAFGAVMGALPMNMRRREDPSPPKTEMVEKKRHRNYADILKE